MRSDVADTAERETRLQVLGLPVPALKKIPSAARVGPEFAEKQDKKEEKK